MGATERRTDSDLEWLFQRGYDFGFFQAVRLLLRSYPGQKPVGLFGRPSDEAVRFHGHTSLAFPSGVIHAVKRESPYGHSAENSVPAHVSVAVLGLTGYAGVLPAFYAESIVQGLNARRKNEAFPEFLDLFNHRLISLIYRSWEKVRPFVAYERSLARKPWEHRFSADILALLGLGSPPIVRRSPLPPQKLIRYAGMLYRQSAATLAAMLADNFGRSFEVIQFRGRWCSLAAFDRAQLGPKREDDRLGAGSMIGSSVWYPQASFRIRVSAKPQGLATHHRTRRPQPLSFDQFVEFLPGGRAFDDLVEMAVYFTRQRVESFEIELTLRVKDVPRCELGGRTKNSPRLGWVAWLGGRPAREAVSVVFQSTETIVSIRRAVNTALRTVRASLEVSRGIELTWSEAVVDEIMARWDGVRKRGAAHRQIIASELKDGIAERLAGLDTREKAPSHVHITASEREFQYVFS